MSKKSVAKESLHVRSLPNGAFVWHKLPWAKGHVYSDCPEFAREWAGHGKNYEVQPWRRVAVVCTECYAKWMYATYVREMQEADKYLQRAASIKQQALEALGAA